jgi:multiple sugar transport system substrate-binding protein
MAFVPRHLGPALLITLLVLPLTLTGASFRHHAHAPVVINVAGCWYDKYQGTQSVKIFESYNKAQSDIVVHATYGATAAQMVAAESAGKPPDVYFDCGNGDIGTWATNGIALDLTPYIQQSHFDLNRLTSAARQLITVNGHIYAMPYLTDEYMLLWNKKLFRAAGLDPTKPPKTLEEMLAMLPKLMLHDSSGKLTSIGFSPTYSSPDFVNTFFPIYVNIFGGRLVSPDGKKITANCAACVKALQFEQKVYQIEGISNIEHFGEFGNPTPDGSTNLWLQGKVAFEISGEWNPKFVKQYGPKGFEWDNAPLPYPAAQPSLANAGEAGGNLGTIFRKSKHPAEAFKFLTWIQNVGPTVAFANVLNNVPQVKAALTSPQLNADPHYRKFVHYAGTARVAIFPNLPISAQYTAALATMEQQVLHGKMSVQRGLDKVTHDMQALLDQQSSGV